MKSIKKGDLVKVISGKYKGKEGKVLKSIPKTNRVIVEGVAMTKRHQRANQQLQQGGIIEREGTIDVTNVMLVCMKCNRPVRTHSKVVENKKVRVCSRCEEVLDNV